MAGLGAGLLSGLGFGAGATTDTIEKELDSFLDRVNEDDLEGETLMATPMARSPDRSGERQTLCITVFKPNISKLRIFYVAPPLIIHTAIFYFLVRSQYKQV